jgi:hypothetical protein
MPHLKDTACSLPSIFCAACAVGRNRAACAALGDGWPSDAARRYDALMTNSQNSLDLLGKRVRYCGRDGLVVSRFNPQAVGRDRLASLRDESVTIRFEGQLGATFIEVDAVDLGSVELLEG